MADNLIKLLLDPAGPLGLTEAFYQNVVAEAGGFVLGALVFSLLIPIVIDARQARKWRPARQNFGQELMQLHVAFGDALLRFLNSPDGAARLHAAEAVDHGYRAVPNLVGLFGYALTADISREVNDYMRELRAIRDWSHEASHPEDLGFASVERRVQQSRDMFARANREFKDVLDVLGLNGYADVRWSDDLIAGLSAAFDRRHARA